MTSNNTTEMLDEQSSAAPSSMIDEMMQSNATKVAADMESEVGKRRTFAIISHPDAGKTTLTEKLLLYGGAIHLAGSVKQRKAARHATSDWMALEKERGISVSTSVMQFNYDGFACNLLDTPGHNDFSEDTYRTLAAVDAAIMLIDCVKGVEPQTIKLFEVCRMRGIPIVTFINKFDRHGKEPLDLLDEIEKVLQIPTSPITWPVGIGPTFQGVYDRLRRTFYQFERNEAGQRPAPLSVGSLDDESLIENIGANAHNQLLGEISLLEDAGNPFTIEDFLAGKVTPVFFGSAMTNFGVEVFLQHFLPMAPTPMPRTTVDGQRVNPTDKDFTGFVFKIQANMDPNHRDRIAFVRLCSGKFTRGMDVKHARTGKKLNLSKSMQFMAQERNLVEEAYAGDILGLWDPGVLRIGDALCTGPSVEFAGVPRFSPEHFVRVRLADPMKRKQLRKGLEQLSDEGAVQLFFERDIVDRDLVLGAVGWLQFEVTQYRLKHEYSVDARFDRMPFTIARWVESEEEFDPKAILRPGSIECLIDVEERPILLFENQWMLRRIEDKHPKWKFVAAVQPGKAKT